MTFIDYQPRIFNYCPRDKPKGKNTHSGAERPAACGSIRGNKSTALLPRIQSQAAGRSSVCVFLP